MAGTTYSVLLPRRKPQPPAGQAVEAGVLMVGTWMVPRRAGKNLTATAAHGLVPGHEIISVSVAAMAVGERPDTALTAGFAMAQLGVPLFQHRASHGRKPSGP